MLCEKCGKNQATSYIETIINGDKKVYHLCASCAQEVMGKDFFTSPFSLGGFLSGMLGDGPAISQGSTLQGRSAVKCPLCGSTLDDIRKAGRAGCASCYETFFDTFSAAAKRIHGSASHTGRRPSRIEISPKRRIKELEKQLSEAVVAQEYEKAATIRDEIRALKGEEGQK